MGVGLGLGLGLGEEAATDAQLAQLVCIGEGERCARCKGDTPVGRGIPIWEDELAISQYLGTGDVDGDGGGGVMRVGPVDERDGDGRPHAARPRVVDRAREEEYTAQPDLERGARASDQAHR